MLYTVYEGRLCYDRNHVAVECCFGLLRPAYNEEHMLELSSLIHWSHFKPAIILHLSAFQLM